MIATVLAAASSPCWKTYATGLLIGAMGWSVFFGSRRFRAHRADGNTRGAVGAAAAMACSTLAGLAVIGAGMGAGA